MSDQMAAPVPRHPMENPSGHPSKTSPARWSIIVHGGARKIASEDHDRNRAGCRDAAAVAAAILASGGSALDAAVRAVIALEDDPTYNAGTGSVTNRDGDCELDAAVMDGTTLDIGAVAALRAIRNPVTVAKALLREEPVLLVGDGAQRFAYACGLATESQLSGHLSVPRSERQHDTVGCVARDATGAIAVATSTGGLTGQLAGRVGDAPLAGCGFYADDGVGGVAISGDGESITRVLLAAKVMHALEAAPAQTATGSALATLKRVGGEAGIITIDHDGRFGVAHNSDQFSVALAASWLDEPRAAVHVCELEDILHDD